jgi:hypothetical protein
VLTLLLINMESANILQGGDLAKLFNFCLVKGGAYSTYFPQKAGLDVTFPTKKFFQLRIKRKIP